MTATFDPDLNTERDRLRAALGDTDETDALLSDEQIDAQLMIGSYDLALITLGTQVLAQMPTKVQVVGLSVDMSGPIAVLKTAISDAKARIDSAVPRVSTFQVRRPQRFGADGGSEYSREREVW